MKAEKTLKVWSIVTLSFSIVFLSLIFFTLFASLAAGTFYSEFYEEFTNDLGGDPTVPYRLFFQIELYCLVFFVISNQFLMWARSIILKRNDTSLRKELETCKCCEVEKTIEAEIPKKNKDEKKEEIKKDKDEETDINKNEEKDTKKDKKEHKKNDLIKEETVTITKTTTVRKNSREAKINAFLNKNGR